MEKDWGARFEDRPRRAGLSRTAAAVAGIYWALTVGVFLALESSGADMIGDGAIPVAFLTFPWSVLMIMAHPTLRPDPNQPYHDLLVSPLGTFVLLPLIGGALNAVLLYWLVAAIERRRRRRASDHFIDSRARLFKRADFNRALGQVPDVEPEKHDRL